MAVAFDIAFRIPNTLRNLVAEGALAQSFIPIYENYKKQTNEREVPGVILSFMFIALSLLSVGAHFLLPFVIPSLVHDPEQALAQTKLTIDLCQILFPYIIFMSLSSIYMGIQYSYSRFLAPSFGPALLNIIVFLFFGFYLFFEKQEENKDFNSVYIFSVITLFAAFVHLIFQIFYVKKIGLSPKYSFQFKNKVIKSLFIMMLPAVFAAGVQEIGHIIDIYLATYLHEKVPGAVSALTYSHRILHLPIGVIGVAVSTASLPQLSKLFAEKNIEAFKSTLSHSLSLNLFLLLPAALGVIFLSEPIIGLIFERGEFDLESTKVTAYALKLYAIGIPAYGVQKLFTSAFYAQKNSKTPAKITVFILIINIALSILFMRTYLHGGLALGSASAAYIGIFIYVLLLYKTSHFSLTKSEKINFLKIILLNLFFAIFIYFLQSLLSNEKYHTILTITIGLAFAFYSIFSRILNIIESKIFIDLWKNFVHFLKKR